MGSKIEKFKHVLSKIKGKLLGTDEEVGLVTRAAASVGYYPSSPKELKKLEKYYQEQRKVRIAKEAATAVKKLEKMGCVYDPHSGSIVCTRPVYTTTGIMPAYPSRRSITITEQHYRFENGKPVLIGVTKRRVPASWAVNPATAPLVGGGGGVALIGGAGGRGGGAYVIPIIPVQPPPRSRIITIAPSHPFSGQAFYPSYRYRPYVRPYNPFQALNNMMYNLNATLSRLNYLTG